MFCVVLLCVVCLFSVGLACVLYVVPCCVFCVVLSCVLFDPAYGAFATYALRVVCWVLRNCALLGCGVCALHCALCVVVFCVLCVVCCKVRDV